MDPARVSHRQITGSCTKDQGTTRRQQKHCNNNRIAYSSGVTTPDLCGALLTTEQQAHQCQQSHLMVLWLNEQVIRDTFGSIDRMLTYRQHVETTALKRKKGLSVLKAMAAKGIEQRHLFLLYQSVVLRVIDYGLGLTTMAQKNMLNLDRVQNEVMPVILRTTKGTPSETVRFMLDLPPVQTRQKVDQVIAYFSAVINLHDSL